MPAVFVHGVPDTTAMWTPLLAELRRGDVVTLALPGFASPLPVGFGATKEEYAAWVAEQVTAVGEPVDLVGHDWGSLITERVALTRPELLRSFTMIDAAVTEAFAWHELAVQWQTPEVGEQIMAFMTGEVAIAGLRDAGRPDAEQAEAAIDDVMRRSILALYRSAVDIAREWAPTGRAARPGLVLWGRDDPYAPPASGEGFARVTGARFVVLEGGHWAVMERPRDCAAILESFWAGLE